MFYDNDDNDIDYSEEEVGRLISRYEENLQRNSSCYFDIEEFETIIEHYIEDNNPGKAYMASEQAERFHPYSNDLKLRKAEVLIIKGQPRKALVILDEIMGAEQYNSDLYLLQGRAYLMLNKLKDAIALFKKALTLNPELPIDILQNIAGDLLDIKEYKSALKYLQMAYEREPDNIDVLCEMAYCYERMDDLPNSIKYHEQILTLDTFNDTIWYNLGTLYARSDKHEKAIEAFDYALAINDGHASACYNKAHSLLALTQYEKAIETFNEFLVFEPTNLQVRYTMGKCYEYLQRTDEALETYSYIVNADPTFADAYHGLALLLMNDDQWHEAHSYVNRAIEINRNNSDYWFTLGKLLLKKHDEINALTAFNRVCEIDPYDFEAWLVISELKAKESDLEALLVLKKAYAHNPEVPQLCHRLAAIYYRLGDLGNCLFFLEKGLQEDMAFPYEFFGACPEALKNVSIQELVKKHTTL